LAKRTFSAFALVLLTAVLAAGCVKVTYPADKVEESVERIAKEVFDINVIARVSGQTLGVLYYMPQLMDEHGGIDQDVFRKTNNQLVTTITRVALSTDLKLESIVVTIRGEKDFNEVRFTFNIDDIKRAYTDALSGEELQSRTLIEQSKYRMDAIDPSYFPLKEISLENFLARQVVQRIRFAAAKPQVEGMLPSELIDGRFIASPQRVFEFSIVSFDSLQPELNVLRILKTASQVLFGYEFTNYDRIIVKDLLSRKMLIVDREVLNDHKHKKVTDDDLLRLGFKDDFSETDRLRNVLEVFGLTYQ